MLLFVVLLRPLQTCAPTKRLWPFFDALRSLSYQQSAKVNLVCKACFTSSLLPSPLGARLGLTASHVDREEEGVR